MNDRVFDSPVFVKGAPHFIQEIASLDGAVDFLEEWPSDRRGPIYETALRACHRAYAREVPLDVAHKAFSGFAKSVGILEQVDTLFPFAAISQSGRGGLPT